MISRWDVKDVRNKLKSYDSLRLVAIEMVFF